MSTIIVSAFVTAVFETLRSVALKEIGVVWGLQDDLQSLENVLDRIATFGLRRRADSERGVQHKFTSFSGNNPLLFRLKMVGEVKKRKSLEAIADERLMFHLGEGVVENRFGETSESRETSSVVNELEINGRDEEKEMIIGKLVDGKADGKEIFIGLDDVWNENHVAWDELKEVLRCGSKGSVLLVTTRIEKVALMMATVDVHHIGFLSEENSWSLFRQRAFTNGVEEESHIAIGKAIVKKCGGVPLAIKALGSLMRFKSHESEWLAIKESEIWQLSYDEDDIFPILRLSYYNLAPQMRQCFAYCCLFPKDHVMEEKQLIQLWMANGFVPSQDQSDLYFSGHLIFKELVWRSFLQDVMINSEGNVTCKMHDLMHDLAVSVMKHETCVLESDKVMDIPKTLRHLSFDMSSISEILRKPKFPGEGSLRSLISHERLDFMTEEFSSSLSKQQNLRAFHIKD
ncbi:UNVERIFIED_CONTAM: putative disease resistance protein RGA3 [Sesamum radiatum]|uniref:Disease resistance protein RGA3 n=1 Tax=Sesamum radiatum TaxID=300843 RepID=A0AAW2VNM7_SESRA